MLGRMASEIQGLKERVQGFEKRVLHWIELHERQARSRDKEIGKLRMLRAQLVLVGAAATILAEYLVRHL